MPDDSIQWEPVPKARLRAPGAGGANARVVALRGAVGLFAVAVVWHAFILIRPLPGGETEAGVDPPDVPRFEWPERDLGVRQAHLDAMRGNNFYASDRLAWSDAVAIDGPEEAIPEFPSAPVAVANNEAGALRVDDEATLPEDIKKAKAGLTLRGIRSARSGGMVAMISLVHSSDPIASTGYRVGDTFTDPKNAQAEWRIAGIDSGRDRVVLERAGKRVALDLYPSIDLPRIAAIETISATNAQEGGPVRVEQRTRAQIAAELLEADISTEEIRLLLDLLDEEPGAVRVEEAKAAIPDPEVVARKMREARESAPAPSEDMELLIRLMASGENPVEFMEQREREREQQQGGGEPKQQ